MNAARRSVPLSAPPDVTAGSRPARGSFAIDSGRLSVVRDPLRMLLFALTILTVSRVHQHYPLIMKLRPALLLIMAAAGYAYLNPQYLTRSNVLKLWPMRLVAILGVLACASAVFGISLGATATFILDSYVKTLIYAFLLAASIRHVRDLYTFVWAYVISCGILAFFSLFVFGLNKVSVSYVARLDHLYTYDANDLGVMMMVGLPLTLLLLLVARGKWRWVLLLNLVGICATIARSGSRGGFLGFVAVGIAALLLANSVSVGRRTAVAVAAALALAVGAPSGYWLQMGTVLKPKQDYNYSTLDGRKAVAERGLGYMARYPVFGIGINNFSRAECTISPKLQALNRTGPIRCTAPHNSYVQAGAELGIPGLIAWVWLVLGMIGALLRVRRRLPRSWRRGTETHRFIYGATTFFPLAMIGFAVTAFFVSFAWMDALYIMAALTTGLYVVIRQALRRTDVDSLEARLAHHPAAGGPEWRMAARAHRFSIPRSASHQTAAPCVAR